MLWVLATPLIHVVRGVWKDGPRVVLEAAKRLQRLVQTLQDLPLLCLYEQGYLHYCIEQLGRDDGMALLQAQPRLQTAFLLTAGQYSALEDNDSLAEVAVRAGLLPVLAKLLSNSRERPASGETQSNICWIMSNLFLCGTVVHGACMANKRLLKAVFRCVDSSYEPAVHDTIWAASNFIVAVDGKGGGGDLADVAEAGKAAGIVPVFLSGILDVATTARDAEVLQQNAAAHLALVLDECPDAAQDIPDASVLRLGILAQTHRSAALRTPLLAMCERHVPAAVGSDGAGALLYDDDSAVEEEDDSDDTCMFP